MTIDQAGIGFTNAPEWDEPTLCHVFPNGVPCVHETQATREQLFKHGFDVRNGTSWDKKTWIGTVEVWSYEWYIRLVILIKFWLLWWW